LRIRSSTSFDPPSGEKTSSSRRTTCWPTTKPHFLAGPRVGRRQSPIFSSDYAPADDKVSSSRRTTRRPTTKSHLLVGLRAGRRQSLIFSSDCAPADDKVPSSRRTARRPTTKSHFLVGLRAGRRQSLIFSSDCAPADDKVPLSRRTARWPTTKCKLLDNGIPGGPVEATHPEFNPVLSRGLLQLRGEELLLSQQLIDAISADAQRRPQLQAADSGQLPGGHDDPGCAGRAPRVFSVVLVHPKRSKRKPLGKVTLMPPDKRRRVDPSAAAGFVNANDYSLLIWFRSKARPPFRYTPTDCFATLLPLFLPAMLLTLHPN
jgi:hypothetical protein